MKIQLRGREVELARLGEIRVQAVGVDLAELGAGVLYELHRNFASTARRYRLALSVTKKSVRRGAAQIAQQLAAEAERRASPPPRPSAASLTVVLKSVEETGYLAAFLAGLEEVYLSERAKIARQDELERNILDIRSIGFECGRFCGHLAAAINESSVEV